MKGKNTFTKSEIVELKQLINMRQNAPYDEQKRLRDRMRDIGFYGRDDWGIVDCHVCDLEDLINSGNIIVI
ncbi:MAG: hypothetical protein OSJ55_08145 [Bacteroidales bacterium]|nr:hypothetical protein [Bacteroidales bacterium]